MPSVSIMSQVFEECRALLHKTCQFKPPKNEKDLVPKNSIYRFAVILLDAIKNTTIMSSYTPEGITSAITTLAFGYISDRYIIPEDVSHVMCNCPRGAICRRFKCRQACANNCRCGLYLIGVEKIRVTILHYLCWNLDTLRITREMDMHFMPCITNRLAELELEGLHNIV